MSRKPSSDRSEKPAEAEKTEDLKDEEMETVQGGLTLNQQIQSGISYFSAPELDKPGSLQIDLGQLNKNVLKKK